MSGKNSVRVGCNCEIEGSSGAPSAASSSSSSAPGNAAKNAAKKAAENAAAKKAAENAAAAKATVNAAAKKAAENAARATDNAAALKTRIESITDDNFNTELASLLSLIDKMNIVETEKQSKRQQLLDDIYVENLVLSDINKATIMEMIKRMREKATSAAAPSNPATVLGAATSALPSSSSSSSSSSSLPPDQTPKLKRNLAKISTTLDELQKNKTFIDRVTNLGTIEAEKIDTSVSEIKKLITSANEILENPAPSNADQVTVGKLIDSAQGAINKILLDLDIPSTDIATVQLEGGRRTRRKRKGSKKRTRRARRRHR